MVTVGVPKLDYAGFVWILVDPGVKINEICYCDLLLSQQLLPDIYVKSPASSANSAPVYCRSC